MPYGSPFGWGKNPHARLLPTAASHDIGDSRGFAVSSYCPSMGSDGITGDS